MKKTFLLKTMLLLCALIVGSSAWADVYTIGWGNATGNEGTYTNFTDVSGTVENLFSFSTAKNSSQTNPAYNSNSNQLRLYYHNSGNGGSITITPATGITITGFEMATATTPNVNYTVDNGTATAVSASGNTYTVTNITANTSLMIQNVNTTNTQLQISTIKITYTVNARHTATFYVNGDVISSIMVEENHSITFPDNLSAIAGKAFMGWRTNMIEGTTNTRPTDLITSANMGEEDVNFYAVFAYAYVNTDVLTRATTGATSTTYIDWSDKTLSSDAVYAGNSGGGNSSIQLNNGSPKGIITTASGGKVKKITVVWNSNTTAGRTLDVYGKNTAYSGSANLYNTSSQGTKLGSIVKGTNTELTISDNYEFIGLRSNSGAMYLDEIQITWQRGSVDYSSYCTSIPESESIEMNNYGLATYASDYNLNYSSVSGLEAYIARDNEGTIELQKVNQVPAGTGVLLRATNSTSSFTVPIVINAVGKVTGNLFVRGEGTAVASGTGSGPYNYILNVVNDQIGFYRANNQTVATNRAYLHTTINAPSDESRIELTFDGQTGIATVNRETTTNNRYFDLQGRPVAQPTKGLYIVNGKKVLVK